MSCSVSVSKQSFINSSIIELRSVFLMIFITENAFSTLVIVTGKVKSTSSEKTLMDNQYAYCSRPFFQQAHQTLSNQKSHHQTLHLYIVLQLILIIRYTDEKSEGLNFANRKNFCKSKVENELFGSRHDIHKSNFVFTSSI